MNQEKRQKAIHEALKNELAKARDRVKKIDQEIQDGNNSKEKLDERDSVNSLLSGLIELESDASKMDVEFQDEYLLIQSDEKDCHMAVYINPETDELDFSVVHETIEKTLEALKNELEKKVAEKAKDDS